VFDLNHILLFIACVSPLVLLAQAWRRGGLNRAWRIAAFAVLGVSGLAWLLNPDNAGFVGGGAWLVLIVLPSFGMRRAAELSVRQRYGAASRLLRGIRLIHPANGLVEQSELLGALDLAQRGDLPSALNLLSSLAKKETNVGRQAIIQGFRLRRDWAGLLEWGRMAQRSIQDDVVAQPIYLRAVGETGGRDQLLLEFAANRASLSSAPQHVLAYDLSLMLALAFSGRVQSLSELFETKLRPLSHGIKEFWLATAQLTGGQIEAGRARLENLRANATDALVRGDAIDRLNRMNEITRVLLSPAGDALLRRLEQHERVPVRVFASDKGGPTPVVLLLIALNVIMFVAESVLGGSTNPWTLHQLGALEFFSVFVRGEYWRLVTSLFLHFGPLHLLFNLYALFIIGPGLERAIGSFRFGFCYLLSGLGSSIGVLLLRLVRFSSAEQLVGASGCVMGLVGVWAGLLLRHRHAPMAGRRLKNIVVIVAIQTAFDLSTPQISMAAHLSGLLSGLGLGLLLAPKTLPT
jgi:rhomboid protease GluP